MHAELLGGAPFKRALTIGCGLSAADRSLHLEFGFEYLLGLDVSAGAIEKAQQFAGEARLPFHYRAVDLNAGLPVASAPFDMIYAMAAIHHIEALERLFDAVAKSLVPTTGRF
jgi:SAM-dependent methyltransferase